MALRTVRRSGVSSTAMIAATGTRAPRPGLGSIPAAMNQDVPGVTNVTAPIDWGGLAQGGLDLLGDIAEDYVRDRLAGGTPSEPPAGGNPTVPGNLTGDPQGCPPGTITVGSRCVDPLALPPGGRPAVFSANGNGTSPFMGNGSSPMVDTRQYRECGRGMILARDGLCYDKRLVRNNDRMWPKGRKPLLTGGEMNAITKAARAARRVRGTQKKLQRLGLLPKPNRGARGGSPGRITKSEAARALRS